jgi:5-methylcytosine-specific restriction endonuclease McrA
VVSIVLKCLTNDDLQILKNSTQATIPCEQSKAESNKKKQKTNFSKRQAVWKTYIGMAHGETECLCCKSNKIDVFNFHCGHVVSSANGGNTHLSNLRPICSVCNNSMGTIDMKEFAKEQFDIDIE